MVDLETVKKIAAVALQIYKQVQLVKGNKKQCKRLADRVKSIMQSLDGLDAYPDTKKFNLALGDLKKCLDDCLSIMKELAKEHWLKKFVKAGSHKEDLAGLNKRLQQLLPQLSLGINVTMLFKLEEDIKDQHEDLATVLTHQDELKELNNQELKKLTLIKGDIKENRGLLEQVLQGNQKLQNKQEAFGKLANVLLELVEKRFAVNEQKQHNNTQTSKSLFNQAIDVEKDKTTSSYAKYKKNYCKKAFELYKQSAALGYYKAQTNLSFYYLKGLGVIAPDYAVALDWLHKSAAQPSGQKHARTLYNIGYIYSYEGLERFGIRRNLVRALAYFEKAMQLGSKEAKSKYDKYKAQIKTTEEVSAEIMAEMLSSILPNSSSYASDEVEVKQDNVKEQQDNKQEENELDYAKERELLLSSLMENPTSYASDESLVIKVATKDEPKVPKLPKEEKFNTSKVFSKFVNVGNNLTNNLANTIKNLLDKACPKDDDAFTEYRNEVLNLVNPLLLIPDNELTKDKLDELQKYKQKLEGILAEDVATLSN